MKASEENKINKGNSNIKEKTLSNFLWRFLERFSAQIISFVISIVLARILDPEAYGMIALVMVFTNVLQIFVDSGLGNALIQKKNVDDTDFSSVFYFNIIWCLILYAILFICAPWIASFYGEKSLTLIVRVLGLTIIVSGVKNIQQAYVSRTLQFKKFFGATLCGSVISAVVGITLALCGYGVWALVSQYLSNLCIDTIILWITVRWRPRKLFDLTRLRELFSYGWKLLASGIIDAMYENLCQLIIGKVYTAEDLAFYNRGSKFPNVIVSNINRSIDSVLLPVMSREQDDLNKVKNITRRSIKTSIYVMAPLMIGLCSAADPVVRVILTEKWLQCVPYLRIFCISYIFMPIHTSNLNAIKAVGRSDIFLKLEIVKKIAGIAIIIITARISVMAMVYSMLVINIIWQIINSWPNRYLLNYSYLDQIRDIVPSILLSACMGIVVYPIQMFSINPIVTLILQIISGAAVYITGSILFKIEEYEYIKDIVRSVLFKKQAGI